MDNEQLERLKAEAELGISNSHLAHIFNGLCTPCSDDEALHLRSKLAETTNWITQITARSEAYDVELAAALCNRATKLIEDYEHFDQQQKILIAGALRYLLLRNDMVSDKRTNDGLQDDRLIMNHVLFRLGLNELLVPSKIERVTVAEEPSITPASRGEISEKTREAWKAVRSKIKI